MKNINVLIIRTIGKVLFISIIVGGEILKSNLIENAKMNWFIGIRTPWTLSNEDVWDKTNKIGGRFFKIAGFITFLGTFFNRYAIYFILVPILSITAFTVIYSYFEYQKTIEHP